MSSPPDDSDVESEASEPIHHNMRHRRSSGAAEGFYFRCHDCNGITNSTWPGVDTRTELCRNCSIELADKYEFVEQTPLRHFRKQATEDEPAMEADKSSESTQNTPRRRLKRRSELNRSEVNDGTPEPGMRDENAPSLATFNPNRIRRYSDESDSSVIVVAVRGSVTDENPAGKPYPAPTVRKKVGGEMSTGEATEATLLGQDMGFDASSGFHSPPSLDAGLEVSRRPVEPLSTKYLSQSEADSDDSDDAALTKQLATGKINHKEEALHRIEQTMGADFLKRLYHAKESSGKLWKTIRQLVLLPQAANLGSDGILKALVKAEHEDQLSRKSSGTRRLTVRAVEKAIRWVRGSNRTFLTYNVDTASLTEKGLGVDASGFIVDPGSVYDKTAGRKASMPVYWSTDNLAAKTPVWKGQRLGAQIPGQDHDQIQSSVTSNKASSHAERPLLPQASAAPVSRLSTPSTGTFISPPTPPPTSFVPLPPMQNDSPSHGPQSYGQEEVPNDFSMVPMKGQRPMHPEDHGQKLVPTGTVLPNSSKAVTPTPEVQQVGLMSDLQKLYSFHKQMISQHQMGANIVQSVVKMVDQATKDKQSESAKSAMLQEQLAELQKANGTLGKRNRELEDDIEQQGKKLKGWEDKKKRLEEAFRNYGED